MSVLEDVADRLAQQTLDALEAQDDPADDRIVRTVAEAIGNASPTLQEAFLTQVRIRRAERRALEVLSAVASKAARSRARAQAETDEVIRLPGPDAD